MEGQTPGEGRLMKAGWAQERRLSILSQPTDIVQPNFPQSFRLQGREAHLKRSGFSSPASRLTAPARMPSSIAELDGGIQRKRRRWMRYAVSSVTMSSSHTTISSFCSAA